LLFLGLGLSMAQPPEAVLDNGAIRAVFYLPDAKNGYYRGSRFDWSGVVKSVTYKEHSYFGVWFDGNDPLNHDTITGPVEEFLSGDEALGYSAAKPGENFVRIGIGALRKEKDGPFERFGRYALVNPGKWTIAQGKRDIHFTHELNDASSGYHYLYEKTIRLDEGKPGFVLEHRLKNLGKKAIATETYNHNFFVIDGERSGPNLSVKFGFPAQAARDLAPRAALEDSKLSYKKELERGESVFSEINGLRGEARDYDFRIENENSRTGVHVTGDRPISKFIFWSIPRVLSPEPYIKMDIAPGKEFRWSIHYEFYSF
jgi:hypothetical protein